MALDFAKIFNFLQGNSVMHRFDPRAKGVMIIVFSILSFLFEDLILMCILLLATIPFLFLARIWSDFVKGMSSMSFLFIIIILLNTYIYSLNLALIVCLRIVILMMIFSTFFQTTAPDDLMQALIAMKIPFTIAFTLALAFRFVPTMANETEIVMEAQKTRGHQIDEGGFIQQVRNLFPLLIPLMLNSIRRANNVAEALESRAFGVDNPRMFFYQIHFVKKDWIFFILQIAFLIIGIILHIQVSIIPWLNWSLTI